MLETIDRIPKQDKLTETIARKLQGLIRDGNLKPGDKLPSEKELCEAFGVGRSSVREALQALEHFGFIESKQGIGRFLSRDALNLLESMDWGRLLDEAPMFDLMETREVLEVACARLAAQRASDEIIAHMEGLLKDLKQSAESDTDLFLATELQFHHAVTNATGNPVLAETVRLVLHRVHSESERFQKTVPYTATRTARTFEELVAAIKEGNSERAGELMQQHLGVVKLTLSGQRV